MDAQTLARLQRVARGFPAAIALIAPDGTSYQRHDCEDDSDFEIGSISKGVTGLLYVDAIERGEVTRATRLGELLPLEGSVAGDITLEAVATHRSGLPRTVGGHVLGRSIDHLIHGTDPFAQPLADLYADARQAKLRPGRARYSNAGYQLFGQALAAASGLDYSDLVRTRIAEPLHLSPFYAPSSPADLLPGALAGHQRRREVDPWASEAIAPAGGIRASITAMAGLARSLLDGTAPGVAALDPVANFAGPGMRVGAAWMTTDLRGKGLLTWHNGGTGGFRSWLGLRRDRGVGVVVLAASNRVVDGLGLSLITSLPGDRTD
jgi:CubicO group peptidase (beta-lactamase class C family)